MSYPIFVEANNGHFTATLLGAPNVRVNEPTREAAIAALQVLLKQHVAQGDLLTLEIEDELLGLSDFAGKFAHDPTLREICEEAYRLRDEEALRLQNGELQPCL